MESKSWLLAWRQKMQDGASEMMLLSPTGNESQGMISPAGKLCGAIHRVQRSGQDRGKRVHKGFSDLAAPSGLEGLEGAFVFPRR